MKDRQIAKLEQKIAELELEVQAMHDVASTQADELMVLRGETDEDYIADDAPCSEEEADGKLQAYCLAKLYFIEEASRRLKERCVDEDASEEIFKAIMDAVQKGWRDDEQR